MFTDFKNFTQISERLSPAELVAEIHTCFKAFDTIIGKHNIEKIKTIGDSYMCRRFYRWLIQQMPLML
ncbi:MAG: adenylate/guanylate cyclase domain-containing protein [Bacteroidetes bacterium]|nr:adenylate/guanylate cyclase domain-containing protein [Bacteroidota bacterium]